MKTTRIRIGIAQTMLFGGIAAIMLWNAPEDRSTEMNATIQTVRQIQATAIRWSLEAVRVRANPGGNFDKLAKFVPEVRMLQRQLTNQVKKIPEIHEDAARATRAYNASAEALRERIERFKTAYAVVRNSERYLPIATADLIEEAQENGDDALARETTIIAQEMTQFIGTGDDETGKKISERLGIFERSAHTRPALIAGAMGTLSAHARVILEKRARTDDLLREITAGTLTARATRVEKTLIEERTRLNEKRSKEIKIGLGAGGTIPVLWMALGLMGPARTKRKSERTRDRTKDRTKEQQGRKSARHPEEINIDIEKTLEIKESTIANERMEPRIWSKVELETDKDGKTPISTMKVLLESGAIIGMMGQTISSYARRLTDDLEFVANTSAEETSTTGDEENIQRIRRAVANAKRLAFFGQRMNVFGKQTAKDERTKINVNAAMEDAIAATHAREKCTIETQYGARCNIEAIQEDITVMCQIAVEHALRAIAQTPEKNDRVQIRTHSEGTKVVVTVDYSCGWIPTEQRTNNLIPFYGSQEGSRGVELPCSMYIARRYGGKTTFESKTEGGAKIEIELDGSDH